MQACSTFSLLMKSSFAHSQEMKKDQFCFSLSVKHDHINWQCSFVYPLHLTLPDQYKFSWLKGKLKDEYAVQVNTGLLQCSFNISILCISLNKLLVGITQDSLNRSSLTTLSSHLTEVMLPGTWVMSHKILVIRYTWLFWGATCLIIVISYTKFFTSLQVSIMIQWWKQRWENLTKFIYMKEAWVLAVVCL